MAEPLFNSTELANILGINALSNFEVTGFEFDDRQVKVGDVYLAFKGKTLDGHDFLGKAAHAGAVAALVTHVPENAPPNLPLIIVPNVLEALTKIGCAARAKSQAQTIFAVTGSVGKTTVRAMLEQACQSLKNTHASTASFNNHLGVPQIGRAHV